MSQIEVALSNIDAALAGRSFRTDDERCASLAVLRMAPRLFRVRTRDDEEDEARARQPLYHPKWTEAEANDQLERLQAMHKTREECAAVWAENFHEFGPEEGEYQTLEEAQEWGRKVFDRIQAQPEFIPHAKLNSQGSAS